MTQSHDKFIDIPSDEGDDGSDVRFSVKAVDASVNKAVPVGAYAICVPIMSQEAGVFVDGDLLYIERLRQGMKENSLRRVSLSANGKMRLSTHSTEAVARQDISYPPAHGGEKIRLIGRVIAVYALQPELTSSPHRGPEVAGPK